MKDNIAVGQLMELEFLNGVMGFVTALIALIAALISLKKASESKNISIENERAVLKQNNTISNLDSRSSEIERKVSGQNDTISKLDKSIKSSSRTSGSNLAKFDRSNQPVVVDDGVKVVMVSPSLGQVCGNAFSWENNELSKWRNEPQFEGRDAKGYYMELEISNLQEGNPCLEIRPIRADYNAWWEQPLNQKSSDPSNGLFVFNVYISPENRGFHLFRLWNKSEGGKYPICTWLFDQ